MGKVRSDSVPGFYFPRGTFPDPEGNCPIPRGEVQYPVSENICFSDQRSTSCSTFSTAVGVSELNSGNHTIGTTPHQTPSVVSQGILGSSVPTLGCYDSHFSSFTPSFALVDSDRSRGIGCSSNHTSTYLNPVHGCIMPGLGSLPRGQVCSRDLVSFSSVGPHKSAKNEGSSVSFVTFQSGPRVQVSGNCNRQHHSSGLPTETRRHSVCIPVSSLQRDSATVRLPVHQTVCSSHSGQTEHSSGHVVEVSDLSEHRMGTSPVCISLNHSHMVQTKDSAVRETIFDTCLNNKFPTDMSPIPDPKAYAVDAMSHSWTGMLAYAFPLLCLVPKILLKIRSEVGDCKIILIAPAWNNQSWFPDLLDLSCSLPLALPSRAVVFSQNRRLFHPNPEKLALHAWMLSGKTSIREYFHAKLPRESLEQSGSPLGQFMTQNGQSSVLGCVSRKIDRFTVTAQQLDVFFIYLFEEKGYSSSTIKGYRSAISRTIARVVRILARMNFFPSSLESFILKGLGLNFLFHNGI